MKVAIADHKWGIEETVVLIPDLVYYWPEDFAIKATDGTIMGSLFLSVASSKLLWRGRTLLASWVTEVLQ